MNNLLRDLRLPIALVGLGKSGESAYRLLSAAGVEENQILKFDEKTHNYGLSLEAFFAEKKPQTLLVSPGVPLSKPEITSLLNNGVALTSELELAFRFISNETVICVTGSIGKSTVTSIIGEGLGAIDHDIFVGGNLGTPLADYSCGLLSRRRNKAQFVVLELSSYQLENFKNLKSQISVFTYLSPNHLERYDGLEHYYETKGTLIGKTTGRVIANSNGGDCKKFLKDRAEIIWADRSSAQFQSRNYLEPSLLGDHNKDNLSLAFAAFEELNCPPEVYQTSLKFKGLAHRLESLGEHSKILFINDSKATAMDSSIQACQTIRKQFPRRNIIVLLGGKDKNMPWHELACLKSLNLFCVFFGEVGSKAQEQSGLLGDTFSTLKDALKNLKPKLNEGDVVLLSPAGTSLDEFKNFEERGDFFRAWVKTF